MTYNNLGVKAEGYVFIKYNSPTKSMIPVAMGKEAVTARLRFWLTIHVGLSPERAAHFASHSLRRGGATHLRQ